MLCSRVESMEFQTIGDAVRSLSHSFGREEKGEGKINEGFLRFAWLTPLRSEREPEITTRKDEEEGREHALIT